MELFILILVALTALQVSWQSWHLWVKRDLRSGAEQELICDTSALIDGRIADIARSGFMTGVLLIPRPVLRELQLMADKADHQKRERARFGLDVVMKLQDLPINVKTLDEAADVRDVDEYLLTEAKRRGAVIVTTDYNLNKRAQVEKIRVANVNELMHALRVQFMPGESLKVQLVQKGSNPNQAVAYGSDGSMIVVDQAVQHIGNEVNVEVTRSIQTEAGRMIFAKLVKNTPKPTPKQPQGTKPQPSKATTATKHTAKAATTSHEPKSSTQPQPVQETKQAHSSRPRSSRRNRTPEDSLVSLVNNKSADRH